MSAPILGGWGPVKPATEETQELIDKVRDQAEKIAGENFKTYVAIEYREQIVSGKNYLVKTDIGDGRSINELIYEPLPQTGEGPELVSVTYTQ